MSETIVVIESAQPQTSVVFSADQGPQGNPGPQGEPGTPGTPGAAATIAVGPTTTLPAGSSASVVNSGTSSAAVFDFSIPEGATGPTGPAGTPATVAVGSTTTVPSGTPANVTNSGTASAAILDFSIPEGPAGPPGPLPTLYVSSFNGATGAVTGVSSFNGSTGAVTGVSSVNGSSGAVTGIATTAGNLSQFATTTSAQLAGVMSDETGSGSLVFGTSPTLSTAVINNARLLTPREYVTVSATAATGTIQYNVLTQSVLYYTSNASGNWVLNIRGDAGTNLNTTLSTGDSVTVTFLVTQGATAYYPTGLTVDSIGPTALRWQGGTAPTAGNANSVDAYVYTIIKTGNFAFTAFASQTRFA